YVLLHTANLPAAFAMSLFYFIFPKDSFLGRLNLRCQHIINFFEVLGTFCGHILNAYAYIPKYDRLQHIFSGFAGVIAGYYIYKAFISKENRLKYVNPEAATFSATSFSFMIIALWEVQEFISDYLIGSQNQGYYYVPPENDIFFKIFGDGARRGEGQFPLWDTMLDMIDAAAATAVAGIVLYILLRIIKKKVLEKKELSEQKKEKITA
ncbi:MAG: hypothetical protein J1E34_05725, partial [Oscillospiraceae bacterium]|nr:hypothetical protein [Oscillospiraceae bacterium]